VYVKGAKDIWCHVLSTYISSYPHRLQDGTVLIHEGSISSFKPTTQIAVQSTQQPKEVI
jgi:hypothetical protein